MALADPGTPTRIFDEAERRLGGITALVMCHCESVDSNLLDTTVESFDRHFAVNAADGHRIGVREQRHASVEARGDAQA